MFRLSALLLVACNAGDDVEECVAVDLFADADADGHGSDAAPQSRCPGDGFVDVGGDCDDGNPAAFPGATPACGDATTDDDCDGAIDPVDADDDADGVTECGGDCDDTSDLVSPAATEMCNTIDDDCDGLADGADDSLFDAIACGVCPDPADLGIPNVAFRSLNPCVLDPDIESLCHRDYPTFVNTHTNGERLHRILYRTDQPLRDELLIYFPPGPGDSNDQLIDWMAHTGHRLIVMGWMNENGAFTEPDDVFFENLRTELTYGDDTSEYVDVQPDDAVMGRLTTLLEFLAFDDPAHDWDMYLDGNGEIVWDKIVLTGWSEGASQVAFMARTEEIRGVVLISGPKDVGAQIDPKAPNLPPAPWVYDLRATPACRQYGFYHSDEVSEYLETDVLLNAWDAMGLLPLGELGVDVDTVAAPYDGSQALHTSKTDFEEGFQCNPHQAMAMDKCIHEDLHVTYNWLYCNVGVPTPECP